MIEEVGNIKRFCLELWIYARSKRHSGVTTIWIALNLCNFSFYVSILSVLNIFYIAWNPSTKKSEVFCNQLPRGWKCLYLVIFAYYLFVCFTFIRMYHIICSFVSFKLLAHSFHKTNVILFHCHCMFSKINRIIHFLLYYLSTAIYVLWEIWVCD